MAIIGHAVKLSLFLFAVWLLLSGHYTLPLVLFGAGSTLLVVLIAVRVDLVDRETHPVLLHPKVFFYWLWLGREIIKSSIDVSRRILSPRLPISPNVLSVKARQRTDLGKVTYANSITLVPGTVSMAVDEDTITVHALTRAAGADLKNGEMGRRVCDAEGGF